MKLSLPGRKFGGKKEADKLVHHGGINGWPYLQQVSFPLQFVKQGGLNLYLVLLMGYDENSFMADGCVLQDA
jgi:hypothetical protein